jgi:hypothetical protein
MEVKKMSRKIWIFLFLIFCIVLLYSQDKGVLLSEKVIRALDNEISGERAQDYIRHISQYKRDQASDEYNIAAEWVAKQVKKFGLSNVHIEKYPADGKVYYYMQKSRGGWDAEFAELWIIEPQEEKLTSYADIPVSLANRSQSCDVTGELIYLGDGTKPEDYKGVDIKGKIVLVEGSASRAVQLAVDEFGAHGVVHINQRFAHDEPDNVSRVRIFTKKKTFVFGLSHRRGEQLKGRLKRGEKIIVRGIVKANIHPGHYTNVVATIPGTDLAKEEILLVAHLCHYKPGANDNASGSACLMEIGRALVRLIEAGKIKKPKRTIRFLWVPEMSGSIAYAAKHPDIIKRMVAGINFDMVGQYLNKNNSTFYMNRTPHSQPHYINDLLTNIVEYIGKNSVEQLSGTSQYAPAILSLSGSRDALRYRISEYVGGSDQWIFNDSLLAVPCVFLFVWPDRYYHTSGDKPEICDPTQLKRSSFVGAAALTYLMDDCSTKARKLAMEIYIRASIRIARQVKRACSLMDNSEVSSIHESYKEGVNFIQHVSRCEIKTLKSLKLYSPKDKTVNSLIADLISNIKQKHARSHQDVDDFYAFLCRLNKIQTKKIRLTPAEQKAQAIVPVRNANLKGPLGREFLKDKFKNSQVAKRNLELDQRDSRLKYEILNYVNGQNSLLDIRNAVSAEYSPVPLEWVKEYMMLLKEAGILKM